jgi:N-acetylmuramoyl-L-alanine amidase
MALNYIIDHIPTTTPYNRRPAHPLAPKFITIHNTGNPASTARNERAYLTNPGNTRTASYHIVIDEREAIECIPLDENAWAAGDGSGLASGNRTSIHIEICESGNYAQTLNHAVELTAKLLKQYGLTVEQLKRHFDWSGKICPRLMYDGGKWTGWMDFKNKVAQKLQANAAKPDSSSNAPSDIVSGVKPATPATPQAEAASDLQLSTSERKMLVDALKSFKQQNLLSDVKWIDKAEIGTLTLSELAWLNVIILSRK